MRGGLDLEECHGVSPVCSSEAYLIILQTSLICHFSQRWQSEGGLEPKVFYLVFSLCRRQFTYLNTVELHVYLRQYTKSDSRFSPSRSFIMHWHFFLAEVGILLTLTNLLNSIKLFICTKY